MLSSGSRAENHSEPKIAGNSESSVNEPSQENGDTTAEAEPEFNLEQSAASQQEDTSLFPSWITSSGSWFEQQHDSISETVKEKSVGFDAYLARENIDQSLDNTTHIKVQVRQRFSKLGESGFEFKVKARVKLPNSKRDFKFFLDSDPDDFSSIADQKLGLTPGSDSPSNADDSAIAGIGLDQILGANWVSSYKLGVKLRLPLDPYVRAEWTHNENLSEDWRSQVQHRISYFDSEGWKAQSGLGLYRPINSEFMFQSDTGIQYLNQGSTWELFQSFSLHQRINDDTAFEHQIGVSGISNPDLDELRSNAYWLRTELRHRLYKDWLYGKIVPELYTGRSDSFDLSPSLLLELEVYFGATPTYSSARAREEAEIRRDVETQIEENLQDETNAQGGANVQSDTSVNIE
ncbi:MAG: hypothetical protein V7707_13015 [Motiliproteus sp.]